MSSKYLHHSIHLSSFLDPIEIARSCKVSPYPCEGHECACFTQIETPSTHKDTPVNQTSSTSTSTSTSNNEADDESTKITSTTYTKDNASTSTSTTTQHQHSPPSIPTVTQYFPACFICTATVLYSKTNSFMRDNGRWRANCPFCKGLFLSLPLHPLSFLFCLFFSPLFLFLSLLFCSFVLIHLTAEFCHLDFILASAPKRPPQPKPKSKVSSMKKKYSKNKIS